MKREPVSPKRRFEILTRDRFTCQYCGARAPDVLLQVDHIRPVARGGNSKRSNLITACAECNIGKGTTEGAPDHIWQISSAQLICEQVWDIFRVDGPDLFELALALQRQSGEDWPAQVQEASRVLNASEFLGEFIASLRLMLERRKVAAANG